MNGFLLYIGLIGCDNEPSSTVQIVRTPSGEEARDWLDGEQDLIYSGLLRASLDIRGYRPSPEELEWAAQNPDALSDISGVLVVRTGVCAPDGLVLE